MSGGKDTTAVISVMEGVERLLAAVRAGRTSWIPVLVGKLDAAQRRAALPGLKALRKEVRDQWSQEDLAVRGALLVAGAGCHTGAAGAATWMAGSDFLARDWARSRDLAAVVEAQPVEWQIEVATRLAARAAPRWGWWLYYPLVDSVVKRTGCPVPTSETFVRAWLEQGFRADGGKTTLAQLLRADPYTPVLVPLLFELSDVSHALSWNQHRGREDSWATAIADLAATGDLDRAAMIDRCLARLLRGGKTPDQKAFLEVLRALDPTPEEYAARVRDVLALLDGPSVLAGHAQEVLIGLDEAGLVEAGTMVEASAVVLFRAEKKLVRAQLGWLEKAARRSPELAGPVVLAAADAFGHQDAGVQERALNVVARRLKTAGEAVLPELRQAAELLGPVHHARAGGLFGAPVGGGEDAADDEEVLPPVPVPLPLGEPVASAAELAEELSALLAQERPEVSVFERVLDGLIRQTHLDREGLLAALEPVRRAHPWNGSGRWGDCTPRDVVYVVASIAGETPPHRLWDALRGTKRSPLRNAYSTVHGSALAARLEEAAWQVTATRPPCLLATPTDASGALEPAELVARLAGYESVGVPPGPVDLSAALLRVGPLPVEGGVLAAAEALTSPAGREVAQWLRTGGLPAQPSERVVFEPGKGAKRSLRAGGHWFEDVRRVAVSQPGVGADAAEHLADEFRELLVATEPSVARAKRSYDWAWLPVDHWAAMLPWHREELAARWLDHFAEAADRDQRGAGRLLPQLAEAGGPAGLAVHLALAYCLGSAAADDRTGAVDALLVLAARRDLDAGLLGRELGELTVCGTVKTNRLAASLSLAADTGARRTVWAILAAALPGLLASPEPAPRGLGDLLAVAADCARRAPGREPIAEVSDLAARPGSSRAVKAARALRDILTNG